MRFDFSNMGPANQVLFFKKAYKLSYEFWLDKLDCTVSYARQKVEGATFEDAMSHFGDRAISIVVLRDGAALARNEEPYYEVGFRSMGRDVDWFLYLLVNVKVESELVEYFKRLGGNVYD